VTEHTGDTTDILSAVDHVAKELEFHIADSHEIHKRLTEHDNRIEGQLEILADVVLGEKTITFDGRIDRQGGMGALVKAHENGGINAKIPWGKIATLFGTIVTAAATIVVAYIQSSAPTP